MDYRASYTPEELTKNGSGYFYLQRNGEKIALHIWIWIQHYGKHPNGWIDHIDGNKENNDISNLRECSPQENNWNSRIKSSNTSGVKCVYWHKQRQKWAVQIRTKSGRQSFGLHEDMEFAELVASEARAKYHGEFANDGL